MTTMLTGSVITTGASNYILANQRVVDMADKIYLLEPNAAPLYVLVSKLNKRVAINTKVEWIEDVLNPSWTTLAYALSAVTYGPSACTADVTDATIFNRWDVVKIPSTGEVMVVMSASASTGVLNVIRDYGNITAASAASGADVVIIGSAFSEGSSGSDLVTMSTRTANKYNFLQIFRKSVQLTKTLANSELYGGADRPYQRKKKGIELMRDLERSFLYGTRQEDATATHDAGNTNRRTTAGIDYYITTNSTGAGGALTESEFEGFLRSVFRYGSSSRYLFCAPLILSVVSLWAQGKLQTFPKDKTYGIAISQYLSPHGTVNLVKELMLENAGGVASTSNYGGYAYAIELEDVVYRYLQNRDVTMETDIQNPGDDFFKDQYICEVGMEFHHEEKHGKLTGVSS
jgi:hypothetical protein